jgi:hypothetical protein
LLPPDEAADPEVGDEETTGVHGHRGPLQVPVIFAALEPLELEDRKYAPQIDRSVTVRPSSTFPGTVSVTLCSFRRESEYAEGSIGMVFFDLAPAAARSFADELRRAAAESVAGLPARLRRG